MTRPAPYPPETRAKGWRFEVNMEQVEQSDTWLRARNGKTRGLMLLLWMKSWGRVPCGSLPSSDEEITDLLEINLGEFREEKTALLRGWWLADDGLLYFPMLTAMVLDLMHQRRLGDHRRHFDVVVEKHGRSCYYCGCTGMRITLDHVKPRSKGGSSDPENLVPACQPCNSSKGARTPEEWRGA